jgi:hypothetical protein
VVVSAPLPCQVCLSGRTTVRPAARRTLFVTKEAPTCRRKGEITGGDTGPPPSLAGQTNNVLFGWSHNFGRLGMPKYVSLKGFRCPDSVTYLARPAPRWGARVAHCKETRCMALWAIQCGLSRRTILFALVGCAIYSDTRTVWPLFINRQRKPRQFATEAKSAWNHGYMLFQREKNQCFPLENRRIAAVVFFAVESTEINHCPIPLP